MSNAKLIGSKIAGARKKINLSQAQLAQQLFISPQAVGKWERGESLPDIATISTLAEILDVDLNYFSGNFRSVKEKTAPAVDESDEAGSQVVQASASPTQAAEQDDLMNFIGSNLTESDFAGIVAHKRNFKGSSLRGSNFAGADLTGSLFTGSDVREANFDGANLTDCTLSALNLSGASFNETILVRTEISKAGLDRTKFGNTDLIEVKLTKADLRKTVFDGCVFTGVDFSSSDLRGACLDGQVFNNVKFDNTGLKEATFRNATLRNVSFRAPLALTNKYYRAIQTISFAGASMDKLTYAVLKGFGADLSNVTLIPD